MLSIFQFNGRLLSIFCLLFSLVIPKSVLAATIDSDRSTNSTRTEVFEYRLSNGLKVLVKPIFRAPVVSSQIWYKVGSSYEHAGISGISHTLEHFMFKGTKKYSREDFSSIIKRAGGNHNAFTNKDFTAYYQNISSQYLETMFRLESDRMRGLLWNEEEFLKEVKVVAEERRLRTDDNPHNRLYEMFFVNSFEFNPYRIPVIGWMNDIQNYKMQDAQRWFDQWYGPNNAIVVVVGAVDPTEVKNLAERHFSSIPSKPIPEVKPRIEPPSTAEKRRVMFADVEHSYVMLGYRVPSLPWILKHGGETKDVYTMEIISGLLDVGISSRLSHHLVREQKVASQSEVFYNPFARLETMFVLDAVTADGKDATMIEEALMQQVKRLKSEKVAARELEKVKVQIRAAYVYQKDSLFNQGYELGALEAVGVGWRQGKVYLDRIEEVTAEDILRVSKKYLVDRNKSVAILKPQR